MRRRQVFNIVLSIVISIVFILLGVFCFGTSYLRFGEGMVDLWQSCKFYFLEIFGIPHTTIPTVEQYSEVLKWNIFLPSDYENFKSMAVEYFMLLSSKDNITRYLMKVGEWSGKISKIIVLILPCILLFFMIIKKLYEGTNNHHNRDTIPLKVFKIVGKYTYRPIKDAVVSFVRFLREHRYICTFWLVAWIFHLNLASILVEFIAYYLYFAVSYHFPTIYVQLCKLLIDLQVFFTTVPWWISIILFCFYFDKFRKRLAKARLRHFEARNCGFINELPIVSMTCGSMGKKKTTLITDMALSQEIMFRQKALELLKKNDMRFPNFPWLAFEMDLKCAIDHHEVYNIATVKKWAEKKRKRFRKHGNPKERLYGYDISRYGDMYDDGLRLWDLYDVLSTYAQLYFVYIIESSLIVSNYSVRTDAKLTSNGNFPMWYNDFFPEMTSTKGQHSHILDFDTLRLGKKVIEDNPNIGSFEFGVVLISEVGKERGNILDHKEMKKSNNETNQKNDLFNSWLKMCRHSATIDNFPFVKVFTDEQRPESWGADARDLCDIIHIVSSGPQRIALPFYTIEEMISETLFNRFINLYYDMRFRRGDNTLLVYILKGICSWLYRRNIHMYNQYGYSVSHIEKERGTMDGKVEKKKYYIMNKKAYSRRFCTDCFSDYFNDMAKKTKIGLNDYLEYAGEKATVAELKMQNSYFIDALYKNAGSD